MLDKNKAYDLRYFNDDKLKEILNSIDKSDCAIIFLQDIFYIKNILLQNDNLMMVYHHVWVLSEDIGKKEILKHL